MCLVNPGIDFLGIGVTSLNNGILDWGSRAAMQHLLAAATEIDGTILLGNI